jgi:hypothetical protein
MARGLLIAAAVVDVGIAALLIAVSGFILGPGPESMRAGGWGGAALFAAILGCVAAPIAGFAMQRYGRPAGGLIVAWVPPFAGLFALLVPPNY